MCPSTKSLGNLWFEEPGYQCAREKGERRGLHTSYTLNVGIACLDLSTTKRSSVNMEVGIVFLFICYVFATYQLDRIRLSNSFKRTYKKLP